MDPRAGRSALASPLQALHEPSHAVHPGPRGEVDEQTVHVGLHLGSALVALVRILLRGAVDDAGEGASYLRWERLVHLLREGAQTGQIHVGDLLEARQAQKHLRGQNTG